MSEPKPDEMNIYDKIRKEADEKRKSKKQNAKNYSKLQRLNNFSPFCNPQFRLLPSF